MRYTLLGSGTYLMRQERHAAGHLLELEDQSSWLFDCGWGVGLNLLQSGRRLGELSGIILTHRHGDHIGNLLNLVASILGKHKRGLEPRKQPLILAGYPGFSADFQTLMRIMWPEDAKSELLEIRDLPTGESWLAGLQLRAAVVPHSVHFINLAYRVEADGKSWCYSGDCGMNTALIELAHGSDIFVCECGASLDEYQASGPRPNHLSPTEVGQLAAQTQVKHLILTHLYDTDSPETITAAVRQHYAGTLTLGEDFFSLQS